MSGTGAASTLLTTAFVTLTMCTLLAAGVPAPHLGPGYHLNLTPARSDVTQPGVFFINVGLPSTTDPTLGLQVNVQAPLITDITDTALEPAEVSSSSVSEEISDAMEDMFWDDDMMDQLEEVYQDTLTEHTVISGGCVLGTLPCAGTCCSLAASPRTAAALCPPGLLYVQGACIFSPI